jgi:hypothetical protein
MNRSLLTAVIGWQDENCTDLWLADAAVRTLHAVSADSSKPFALFIGFHKPHPFWVRSACTRQFRVGI